MYTGPHVKCPLCCQFLMKPEFSRQIFETYSNIKFQENRSRESRAVPCGRTERHDEANGRFSQFCEKRRKIIACNEFTMNCYCSTTVIGAPIVTAVPQLLEHQLLLQYHSYWSTNCYCSTTVIGAPIVTAVPQLLEHQLLLQYHSY